MLLRFVLLLSLYLLKFSNCDSVRPKIFVYDLPSLASLRNRTLFPDVTDTNYGLDQLWVQLLRGSPYITTNPEEADYFYADAWLFWPNGVPQINTIAEAMQQAGPWWNKSEGADHIFVVTADQGRCEYSYQGARKSIYIQHFGGNLHRQTTHCNLLEKWGGECDRELLAMDSAVSKKHIPPCFIPGQDIIVPFSGLERHDSVLDFDFRFKNNMTSFSTPKTPYLHEEYRHLAANRTTQLFYAGPIDLDHGKPMSEVPPWLDAGYSFGGRQTVFRMFRKHHGFVFSIPKGSSYWEMLSSSMFCLATAGWGWGGRMKTAINRGCIPVIVQDGIKVEFEEQLPLKEYALRVPMWMVHKLPALLEWMHATGTVKKMQTALECTWRLHWWRRPHGRAFEVTLCELKRRLLGAPHIKVDTQRCTMDCGDGQLINILERYNNI